MGFGPFVLISLFYGLLAIRVVAQLARRWRETFDRRFTAADRSLVDQAAFFVLVPIAVALHELGHAVAIWLLGGRVESWGYFLFAGYVGYDPVAFTSAERIVVAAAGTVVNLLLAAGALAVVFGRRPPARAAINELLLQFTFLSLLNALVVYPALDVVSGLNGDWTQMYRGGVPGLSAVILVLHVGLLGLLWWGWRSERVRARVAALTEAPPAARRLSLGRAGRADGTATAAGEAATEAVLREAAGRVASGWPAPVEAWLQRGPEGAALALAWQSDGLRRVVHAWARTGGGVELAGAVDRGELRLAARRLGDGPVPLDADRLTLALRLAMETVEGWRPAEQAAGPS